ncbi:polyprenyl synthetase family protein [Planctomycetota bacterium]|nr:polyprenyl synthetase family protein [Planctomycetota bacterium]
MTLTSALREQYLAECRTLVVDEVRALLPKDQPCAQVLYDLVLDYPLREAKGLRPALCIATCRALGGCLEWVLQSAAVLELYHNAFLIHDDIEDGSLVRRGGDTLHRTYGVPIAINVGDAMLALALQPLLDNMRLVGMGKALRVLETVARMARESAEGQAIELDWVRRGAWDATDADYELMVIKKSAWYTFVTPILIGALLSDCEREHHETLVELATEIGIAFQIQDDVLNLAGDQARYGKEIGGDLWEGKHTLILLHLMRSATPDEQDRAQKILAKPRPTEHTAARDTDHRWTALRSTVADLESSGELSPAAVALLDVACAEPEAKTEADIAYLQERIDHYGSIDYARSVAARHARRAQELLVATSAWLPASTHRSFVESVVSYVVERDR